jgi:ribosomal protein S18 acetylase RimI-like enzyme
MIFDDPTCISIVNILPGRSLQLRDERQETIVSYVTEIAICICPLHGIFIPFKNANIFTEFNGYKPLSRDILILLIPAHGFYQERAMMNLDICTYREVADKHDLTMLMEMAFWWPLIPGVFQKTADWDIRLKDGPVGFCGLVDGRIVSFVGTMDIPTRNSDGELVMIGGIWGVATDPAFIRRGFSRLLMEAAHEHFRKHGYPFSFLCTSRNIIACEFYRRLGYDEFASANRFPSASRLIREKSNESQMQTNRQDEFELDADRIFRQYRDFVQGKSGFVVRQEDFVRLLEYRGSIDSKKSKVTEGGYALASETKGVCRMREIIGRDRSTCAGLLDHIEGMARYAVIDHRVTDPLCLELYRERGYDIHTKHFGVVMVKGFANLDVEEVYGDRFHMGGLDRF